MTWLHRYLPATRHAPAALKRLVRPLLRFLKMYVLRRGFLDGRHGAVLCGLASFAVFTKYAKLWNLKRLSQQPGGMVQLSLREAEQQEMRA